MVVLESGNPGCEIQGGLSVVVHHSLWGLGRTLKGLGPMPVTEVNIMLTPYIKMLLLLPSERFASREDF